MMLQTILIVDDMSENIDLLVDLLEDYDLITALDAQSALEILDEESDTIDLILLDIMMPEMDGFELCKILKQKEKTSKIPIIFLSAKNESEDIQKGFELGGVDYVTKPFHPKELLSRVATHLKLRAYDKKLEQKVMQEVAKNKVQEQLIHQSAKQAALGELLMHIAHQWKQPLSSLSSLQILQRLQLEKNKILTREEQLNYLTKADKLVSFMGTTIETFTNFYSPSSQAKDFLLQDAIKNVLNIADATLKYHNISVSLHSNEHKSTYAIENEINQVILSIFNNAQNILKQREIEYGKIEIFISDNKVIIEDNGGGIDKEMLTKLFLAKEGNSNSSGLGLYIAKEIMEKNGGIISAENTNDGARFTIAF
jgi:DNA-binding response OmpR family regulator